MTTSQNVSASTSKTPIRTPPTEDSSVTQKRKGIDPSAADTASEGAEQDSEHESDTQFDSYPLSAHGNGSNYHMSHLQQYTGTPLPPPLPQYHHPQYSYGYPLHTTLSPTTSATTVTAGSSSNSEPIYSINVYNLSKRTTINQFSDFIVSVLGGEYYRSSIHLIQFYKQDLQDQQTAELKTASIKIFGFELALRLNNALNGHEFEGNVLSSMFGPTTILQPLQPQPVPPSATYFYQQAPSPSNPYPHHHHQRSYSSTSTVLSSPPAIAFPVPILTASQFDEDLIDDDSPNRSPSPPASEYTVLPLHHGVHPHHGAVHPLMAPHSQGPPPPPPHHPQTLFIPHQDPYYHMAQLPPQQQFQYLPTYSNSRFRNQYSSPQVLLTPPARHSRSYSTQLLIPLQHPPSSVSSAGQATSPHHNSGFVPVLAPALAPTPGNGSSGGGRFHARTRSLPINPYLNPWLLASRYQQQQQQYQQHRYTRGYQSRNRSSNKYAPILDVSDDDDDENDGQIDEQLVESLLSEDKDHTIFSESEHVDKCRLFVGNVPFSTHWQELRDFISEKVSGLTRVEIPQQLNGVSKGFAIVFFNDSNKLLECIQKFDGKNFQGRELTVRYDRHMKFIKKYNNIQAMIKNGGLKLPFVSSKVSCDAGKENQENIEPPSQQEIDEAEEKTIVEERGHLASKLSVSEDNLSLANQEQEDELARELINSLKIK